MNMNNIRLFGFDGCPHCDELIAIYKENNIDFEYVDINLKENQGETRKMMRIGKTDSVPIILVNKTILSPENSFKSIEDAFKLTLKFLDNQD